MADLQVQLGNSGLKISKIIVGCMSFGSKTWADWVEEDEEKIFGILNHCYANGIRTFDTANMYSNGESERILGKWLKKYNIRRETVVIMTKCYYPTDEEIKGITHGFYPPSSYLDLANQFGLSRKHIISSVKASTERLGTYIDLLQIHRLDHSTSFEEIMRSLNHVVEQDWVRYIGASSMLATEFAELQFVAEKNGWHKFISMQGYYNLLHREDEREMIPFCKRHNIGLIPWSPNARGILTRPASDSSDRIKSDPTFKTLGLDHLSEADVGVIEAVEKIANQRNVSMAIISTAWAISKGCQPIVGLNSVSRVDEAIAAARFSLTDDEIKELEAAYKTKPVVF